jgi:hypothetical protein
MDGFPEQIRKLRNQTKVLASAIEEFERAFPASKSRSSGITLREHYAGLAMQGLMANEAAWDKTNEEIAIWAIAAADALISELEKTDANVS